MASSLIKSMPGSSTLEYHLSEPENRPTSAGTAVYNSWTLSLVYDWLCLGLYLSYVWRCPYTEIRDMYARLIAQATSSTRSGIDILDIGVGTGYFPAAAPLPADTSLTLFDLNLSCLAAASERCRRAHKERGVNINMQSVCGDFLAPRTDPDSIHQRLKTEQKFDLVFTTMLLHCLPGPPSRKATALAELARLVKPKTGVLAGVTILGGGAPHNWAGRCLMLWHNAMGWFGNSEDDDEVFLKALKDAFDSVEWKIVGAVLVFEAKGPKSI